MTDHSQRATDLLADAATRPTLEASALTLAEAQIHALLAVANEQRTANLIRAAATRPWADRLQQDVDEWITAATGTRETT